MFSYPKLLNKMSSMIDRLARTALTAGAAVILSALNGCNPGPAPYEPEAYDVVEDHLSHMTIEKKVAQLVVTDLYQMSDKHEKERVDRMVRDLGTGSIVILGHHDDKQWTMDRIRELQEMSETPLLVTMDAELGAWMRFREGGYAPFPRPEELGRASLDSIERVGAAIGRELRSLGVHVNFAPVADLATNKTLAVGWRSFGADPDSVAADCIALMKGMQSEGIFTCAKHFPGHGACDTDTHHSYSRTNLSREAFDSTHLVPFRKLVEAGVDMVMAGHVSATSLDPSGQSASVSPAMIDGILREEYGFKGIVVTDALNMNINRKGLGNDPAILAYKAGADMIMMPSDPEAFIKSVSEAVRNGSLPEEELDAKVRRVLELKHKAGLLRPWMDHGSFSFEGRDREFYTFVPTKPAPGKPMIVLLHGYGGNGKGYRPEFVEAARRHGFAICVPTALKDTTGHRGWNVRYPSQEGMTVDDIAFVSALVDTVAARYGLNPQNAFLSGMSNGGEMCYLFAYSRPERFRAISSVAGLTLSWMPQEITPSGKVPFMEIHGDDDDISMWEGDPENTGGWGAYLGVEDAVSRIAAMDGCTVADDPVELPLLDPQAPSRQVTLYRYSSPAEGGLFKKKAPEYEVLLYKVAGGHHSWHLDDFDTCEESIRFFEKYLQD